MTPAPPEIPSLPAPRSIDCLRVLWWMQRGFCHGASKGNVIDRLMSLTAAIAWWPMFPLLAILQMVMLRRSGARYYMSTDRDAIISIDASHKGWYVSEHASAVPGTGQGKKLRAELLPTLLDQAQAQNICIYTTAANRKLAAQYKEELPEFQDVGPGFPRGRKLSTHPPKSKILPPRFV